MIDRPDQSKKKKPKQLPHTSGAQDCNQFRNVTAFVFLFFFNLNELTGLLCQKLSFLLYKNANKTQQKENVLWK